MYFDRDTIRVLKYIRKCGKNGAEWSDILEKFEYANQGMLLTFNSDLYACAYHQNGEPVPFDNFWKKGHSTFGNGPFPHLFLSYLYLSAWLLFGTHFMEMTYSKSCS